MILWCMRGHKRIGMGCKEDEFKGAGKGKFVVNK